VTSRTRASRDAPVGFSTSSRSAMPSPEVSTRRRVATSPFDSCRKISEGAAACLLQAEGEHILSRNVGVDRTQLCISTTIPVDNASRRSAGSKCDRTEAGCVQRPQRLAWARAAGGLASGDASAAWSAQPACWAPPAEGVRAANWAPAPMIDAR